MSEHGFRLIATGDNLGDPEAVADAVFEAGGDDASLSFSHDGSSLIADFDREADSFRAAVTSAIRTLEQAGLHVTRVEPDEVISEGDRRRFDIAAVNLFLEARDLGAEVGRAELLEIWDELQPA